MLGDCIWYENNLCELKLLKNLEPAPCLGFDTCKYFIVTNVQDGIDYTKAEDGQWVPVEEEAE